MLKEKTVAGICVLAGVFCLFYALGLSAEAFDFQRDVSSRFFWTKSYKAAHPKPTNKMPKTMAEYFKEANKAAEAAKDIPSPHLKKDEKLVDIPDPSIELRKYNNPPGKFELNLNSLIKTHKVNSIGVMSPLHDKMVYTSVYYYPSTKTAASELYLLQLDTSKGLQQRLENAHVNQGEKMLYRTGMEALELDLYKTLTVVDWSKDGKVIAIKEKIAHSADGLWKTNLLVYNTANNTMKELSEVREAIKYYWRKKEGLRLADYRWDIYPIGWDEHNPERIVVFAYAFTGDAPKYLGAWSIDYKGNRTLLMSETQADFEVSQNGLCLKVQYD